MKIIKQKTKTLITRDNGRSADCISPNFIYGCLGGCMSSYCYVGRYNNDKVYINENTDAILNSVNKWVETKPWTKTPNQIDSTYYVADIGCSTDVSLHQKHYDWQKIFDFFNEHEKLKSTFATKYPTRFNPKEYTINKEKNRIRVSLMPQKYSDILEPNTDKITDRITSIKRLQEDMEVHINFSPIIYDDNWLNEYEKLFQEIGMLGIVVPCECIFLTYNNIQHERNSENVNELCWKPKIQEAKDSQYAPDNIRYQYQLKQKMINDFIKLYGNYFNPKHIRYIF
jgi:spore photoproduct lyase